MSELLLELLSEEIPARMQDGARGNLESYAYKIASDLCIDKPKIETFVTPRRLGLVIHNLPAEIAAKEEERRGPRIGAPEQAMAGFLKSTGLAKEQLTERDGYYYAVIKTAAVPVAEMLKRALEEMLKNFHWPKSMRWGNGETNWVRPLKNILCTLDGKVLPVEFAGLKANNITYGHRFLAPAKIEVQDFSSYENALKKAYVVLDANERREKILEQAKKNAADKGGWLKNYGFLLHELSGLVEYPSVLCGEFDREFLTLPPEVLITAMKVHQKYLAVEEGEEVLINSFIFASNMVPADGGKAIIDGNQRVLHARLADAKFFFEQDSKIPLEEMAKKLEQITFHAKLGTIAEKIERVKKLAAALSDKIPGCDKDKAIKATELCKADLVSGMVGEFPELQGIMGRYYALGRKVDAEIADAIRDHYSPRGQDDIPPRTPVSICVALADKIDTLTSMFAVGEKPTGSKDPFALRRAALGVLKILIGNGIRFNITDYIDCARFSYDENDKLKKELLEFFIERLKVLIKEDNVSHDVIEAAIVNSTYDDLLLIVRRAWALQSLLNTDDGKNLLAGYKRAANILRAEEKKSGQKFIATVNVYSLEEDVEKSLYSSLLALQQEIKMVEDEDFSGQMSALSKLRQPVDEFFEKVMVNVDDKNTRINRLNLLGMVRTQMENIANFSVIEG